MLIAPDEVDDCRAAKRVIAVFYDCAQFTLCHPGLSFAQQGCKAEVAKCGANPHPIDLFVRFAHTQPSVVLA